MPRTYRIVTRDSAGREHAYRYTTDATLSPGSVVFLAGRHWLLERVDQDDAWARHARYSLTLRHPDGREERGAIRRFREDAPRPGHQFATLEEGAPVTWAVVEQRLAYDEAREPLLESLAERDNAEVESLPDHELEHALDRGADDVGAAATAMARAEAAGLAVELVALDPGEAPDWEEASRYVDALIIEEIDDRLLELCGVRPGRDPRETWLATVQERLRADLESFRAEVETEHDTIEEWDFRGGRIFAAIGSPDDESSPVSGYGWMGRLVDAGVLGAAGLQRVRKAELAP